MNDDVKAAVERFRGLIASLSGGYLRAASRSCGGYNAHNYDDDICRDCGFDGMNPAGEMLLGEAQDLLAHVDGEQARQDAAVAAAREEQREVCADSVLGYNCGCRGAVGNAPLTATPLADRIADLERALSTYFQALVTAGKMRAAAEAERDALRVQVAKMEAQADPVHINDASFAVHAALGWGFDPNTVSPVSLARAAEALSIECMGLRAQVEAARAECESTKCGADCDSATCFDSECHVARRMWRAMDEAKP